MSAVSHAIQPGTRLAVVLGVNQALSWGMTFYLPAVIAGPAAATMGASGFETLGAFSWALLVTGLCAPRVGRWIDRHGGRGALAASIVVMAAGQVLLSVASSLVVWYAGWTVIGCGMALGLYEAAFATAGTLLGREAAPVITLVTMIAGFASSIFWSLGSVLVGRLGWHGLLQVYAVLMVAVNLPLVFLVPSGTGVGRTKAGAGEARAPMDRVAVVCLAGFFMVRWFMASAIGVNVLKLFHGIGLTETEAVAVAAMIGPGQVLGRIVEWSIGRRLGLLSRARLAALLFPLGALGLLAGGPIAAGAFALMYGMSNGILTINRGTLPLALFGPVGYATLLGWLAVPSLLAQASAPTLIAPLVAAVPALHLLMLGGGLALVAMLLLVPLRMPATG
jgi:MFS family permease